MALRRLPMPIRYRLRQPQMAIARKILVADIFDSLLMDYFDDARQSTVFNIRTPSRSDKQYARTHNYAAMYHEPTCRVVLDRARVLASSVRRADAYFTLLCFLRLSRGIRAERRDKAPPPHFSRCRARATAIPELMPLPID